MKLINLSLHVRDNGPWKRQAGGAAWSGMEYHRQHIMDAVKALHSCGATLIHIPLDPLSLDQSNDAFVMHRFFGDDHRVSPVVRRLAVIPDGSARIEWWQANSSRLVCTDQFTLPETEPERTA